MQRVEAGTASMSDLKTAMSLIYTSEKILDAPKHCTIEDVTCLAFFFFNLLSLTQKGIKRMPVQVADEQRLQLLNWSWQWPPAAFQAEMAAAINGIALGQVWVPKGKVYLGAAAGTMMGKCLADDFADNRCFSVGGAVSLSHEMARLCFHKLHPTVKSFPGCRRRMLQMYTQSAAKHVVQRRRT